MTDYATLLRDEVALEYRSTDRIFMQGYVPQLQSVGLVCRFLRWQRGFVIPSSAAFGRIGQAYVTEIHRWAKDQGIPVHYFKKGESKEAFARPLIDIAAKAGGDGRVVLIGIAQEKASIWRSRKAKGQEHAAHPHMDWDREMAFINHFYFYLWDPEFGPAFWKTNAERVFERFYRANKSRSRVNGGSGLGLSIVRALVQQSHGQISIDTGPDRGTTVVIALPG